ncbi:MAG: hypothetical protein HN348_22505, partial [Proteobacteria bacterium]|nr:hypothetical protein [Pseudomonadota bacterium]
VTIFDQNTGVVDVQGLVDTEMGSKSDDVLRKVDGAILVPETNVIIDHDGEGNVVIWPGPDAEFQDRLPIEFINNRDVYAPGTSEENVQALKDADSDVRRQQAETAAADRASVEGLEPFGYNRNGQEIYFPEDINGAWKDMDGKMYFEGDEGYIPDLPDRTDNSEVDGAALLTEMLEEYRDPRTGEEQLMDDILRRVQPAVDSNDPQECLQSIRREKQAEELMDELLANAQPAEEIIVDSDTDPDSSGAMAMAVEPQDGQLDDQGAKGSLDLTNFTMGPKFTDGMLRDQDGSILGKVTDFQYDSEGRRMEEPTGASAPVAEHEGRGAFIANGTENIPQARAATDHAIASLTGIEPGVAGDTGTRTATINGRQMQFDVATNPDGAVATYRRDGEGWVIQIDPRATPDQVERGMAHEIAEIEHRELTGRTEVEDAQAGILASEKTPPSEDIVSLPPAQLEQQLSSHDMGRVAEMEVLLGRMDSPHEHIRQQAGAEFQALAVHMGMMDNHSEAGADRSAGERRTDIVLSIIGHRAEQGRGNLGKSGLANLTGALHGTPQADQDGPHQGPQGNQDEARDADEGHGAETEEIVVPLNKPKGNAGSEKIVGQNSYFDERSGMDKAPRAKNNGEDGVTFNFPSGMPQSERPAFARAVVECLNIPVADPSFADIDWTSNKLTVDRQATTIKNVLWEGASDGPTNDLQGSTHRFSALMHIVESGNLGEKLKLTDSVGANGESLADLYEMWRNGQIGAQNAPDAFHDYKANAIVESIRENGYVTSRDDEAAANIVDPGNRNEVHGIGIVGEADSGADMTIDEKLNGWQAWVLNGQEPMSKEEWQARRAAAEDAAKDPYDKAWDKTVDAAVPVPALDAQAQDANNRNLQETAAPLVAQIEQDTIRDRNTELELTDNGMTDAEWIAEQGEGVREYEDELQLED